MTSNDNLYGPPQQAAPQPIIINNSQTSEKRKPKLNHMLHIILSIVTGGVWLFVYVPLLIFKGK